MEVYLRYAITYRECGPRPTVDAAQYRRSRRDVDGYGTQLEIFWPKSPGIGADKGLLSLSPILMP